MRQELLALLGQSVKPVKPVQQEPKVRQELLVLLGQPVKLALLGQ